MCKIRQFSERRKSASHILLSSQKLPVETGRGNLKKEKYPPTTHILFLLDGRTVVFMLLFYAPRVYSVYPTEIFYHWTHNSVSCESKFVKTLSFTLCLHQIGYTAKHFVPERDWRFHPVSFQLYSWPSYSIYGVIYKVGVSEGVEDKVRTKGQKAWHSAAKTYNFF